MPLYAAIRRSLERKLLIFLGLGFFFEPEGREFATKLRFVALGEQSSPANPSPATKNEAPGVVRTSGAFDFQSG
jgi:hypothetical protein